MPHQEETPVPPPPPPPRTLRQRLRQTAASLRDHGLRTTLRRIDERLRLALAPRLRLAPGERHGVLFVGGVAGATHRYRCEHQAEALGFAGLDCRVARAEKADLLAALGHFELFVAHRVLDGPDFAAFVAAAQAAGKPVVYDVDDLVFDPAALPFIRVLATLPPDLAERFRADCAALARALGRCALVSAATPELAAHVRRLFPEKRVFVHRNAVSEAMVRAAAGARSERDGPPRLAYFSGTETHDLDFRDCAAGLARLMSERPAVRLLLVGYLRPPPELAPYASRIERRPFVDWRALPGLLRRTWINLAPLERANPFAACKSALKYFEAGLSAVPTVASDVPAFNREIRDGANGLLCAGAETWHAALARLLDDEPLRRRLGEAARAHVLAEYTTRARASELAATCRALLGEAAWARAQRAGGPSDG